LDIQRKRLMRYVSDNYVQRYLNQSEKVYWKYGSIYISLTISITFPFVLHIMEGLCESE
jgi:hypothetical protein